MVKIVVDFNTKFIDQTKQIWVLFPGEGYKFHRHFVGRRVVFADLPGFKVGEFDLKDDVQLLRWLSLSEKLKSHHLRNRPPHEAPPNDPARYSRYKWTGGRRNTKGVVAGLYGRAKKGDLVLVTSPGGAWGDTNVGEFVNEPTKVIFESIKRYRDDLLPARRVRWLNAVDNVRLPESLVKQLSSKNAFTQLGKSYYDLIFSIAYPNYIRTEFSNSLFDIKAIDFSTIPDMHLKIVANFAAEAARAFETGNDKAISNINFSDWVLNLKQDEYVPSQRIQIQSPGRNLLLSATITPILAAVLFSIWQLDPALIDAAEIVFENTAAGGPLDPCDIPVSKATETVHKLMSLDVLEKMCKAAQSAKELGGIETPIKTRVEE